MPNKVIVPADYPELLRLENGAAYHSPNGRLIVFEYGPLIHVGQAIQVVKEGIRLLGTRGVIPITVYNQVDASLPQAQGMSHPTREMATALSEGILRPELIFLVENSVQRIFSLVGRNLIRKATGIDVTSYFVKSWAEVESTVAGIRG